MMEEKLMLRLLVIISAFVNYNDAGYFTIVGPRTLQHGQNYTVFLTASEFYDNEILTVDLIGRKYGEDVPGNGSRFSFEEDSFLEKEIKFETGWLPLQDFTLTAEIEAIHFKQSVDIHTIFKKYSVFIQTDKPVYKPGDKVRCRIMVLDAETKPYGEFERIRIELIDIFGTVHDSIEDLKSSKDSENIISYSDTVTCDPFDSDCSGSDEETTTAKSRQKVHIKPQLKAVHPYEFDLATETVIGTWSIKVRINDDDDVVTTQKFEVKEFILPRFEVIVDTQPHVSDEAKSIDLEISAKYTFGKPVKGHAMISAKVYDSKFPETAKVFSKSVDVEFTTKIVQFNLKSELGIHFVARHIMVDFNVTFTEALTGKSLVKSTSVTVHDRDDFTLELTRDVRYFKPGFPYIVKATVRQFDGSLMNRSRDPIKLDVTYYMKRLLSEQIKSDALSEQRSIVEKTPKNGIIDFILRVPENATSIQIEASYLYATASLNVTRFKANTRKYLFAMFKNKPVVGQKLRVEVKSTADWPVLYSIIIGRTGIVHHGIHERTGNQRLSLRLKTGPWMAPTSYLLVYYVEPSGELIYNVVPLKFEAQLPNQMNITLSTYKAKPGSECKIHISTTNSSSIFLLGVDQSVKLLGSGNDIDKEKIISDMKGYDIYKDQPELQILGTRSETTNKSRYLELGEFNTFVLTNALDGEASCIDARVKRQNLNVNLDDTDDSGLIETPFGKRDKNEPKLRRNFQETWLFEDFVANAEGKYSLGTIVPDTISSFVVSGFAIHPDLGLGIATPQKITVFQEFFLKLYLPYSIRLGEVLKVDVSVFNYIERSRSPVTVDVKMFNENKEFEFVETRQQGIDCVVTPLNIQYHSKEIRVEHESGTGKFFLIRALKTGKIKIKVQASSPNHVDLVERQMLVEIEGQTHYNNQLHFFNLTNRDRDAILLPVKPHHVNYIPSSLKIEASYIGDLFGPALSTMHSLVRMPDGSNNEIFNTWLPNIAAYQYLNSTKLLTKPVEEEIARNIAKGYERYKTIRNTDGSLNMFEKGIYFWKKEPTEKPNAWLTAYVAKLLIRAGRVIPINDRHIVEALNYLKKNQKSDGSFNNQVGNFVTQYTSESSKGLAFTAFVTISFLEYNRPDLYKIVNDNALNYIRSQISFNSNYEIAICTYALALSGHPDASTTFILLDKKAIKHGNKQFWNLRDGVTDSNHKTSTHIEIAAYAIMTYVKLGKLAEAVPIYNWLVSNMQSTGGYTTTTDTVVAIEAMALMATKLYYSDTNINVKINGKSVNKIDKNNAIKKQEIKLPLNTEHVEFSVNGKGYALVQLSYEYNTNNSSPSQRFHLSVNHKSSNPKLLHLSICARYIAKGEDTESKMGIIEIVLPSGYVYDSETENLTINKIIKKIETLRSKTHVVFYYYRFNANQVCSEVKATQDVVVTELKQSVVKIYDYYETDKLASYFYMPPGVKSCLF